MKSEGVLFDINQVGKLGVKRKTLDRNWHDTNYKNQMDSKGKTNDPAIIDPLPTLKEKLLARKMSKTYNLTIKT
jgi:hypothetical protein